LDGEYQVIYKSISKIMKTSQMLENIYALYIIEMTNFTQTSETLINKIRQNSNSPIFFVSKANLAEKQKREAVYAFESGADDYLGFPLDVEKIVIRLRALIRMQERIHEQINIWHFQGLKIILESRQVFYGRTEIVLTKIEFDNKMVGWLPIKNYTKLFGIKNIFRMMEILWHTYTGFARR
jgi:DNA-binding response OmpR family regulator